MNWRLCFNYYIKKDLIGQYVRKYVTYVDIHFACQTHTVGHSETN